MNPNLFNKIYNEEVEPPVEVWENIQAHLDNKPSRKFGWFKSAAVISFLALISYSAYYYTQHSDSLKNLEDIFKINYASSKDVPEIENVPETKDTLKTKEVLEIQGRPEIKTSPKIQSTKEQLVSLEENVGFTNENKVSKKSSKKIVSPRYSSKISKAPKFDLSEKESENTPFFGSSYSDSSNTTINSKNNPLIQTEGIAQVRDSQLSASASLEFANSILEGTPNSIIKFETPQTNFNPTIETEDLSLSKDDLKEAYKTAKKEEYNFAKDWSVRTYVAPSTTRSLSKNDIWISDLAYYEGKYNDENNYGLNLQYAFNRKLKLRMGIERIAMSQTALKVPVAFSYINTSNSIDYTSNIKIVNTELIAYDPTAANNLQYTNVYQEIGYVSVPLEIGYEFLQWKKFGFGAYIGASTNFLTNNKLAIFGDDFKANLGESTNLNKIVFGSQISIMAQVKLSNTLNIFVEPRTIFYFNPFNNGNSVRPFTINLNAGLGFRF